MPYTRGDFDHSPFVVFYELTRACDLACRHCRACAQPLRHPHELDTVQACRLMDDLARFPKKPLLVITGGDPLKREDLYDLIAHARSAGLSVAMTPSATPLATTESIRQLKAAGVSRLAVSLDGVDAATHDAFRGVSGSFDITLRMMADANRFNLPLQVNTTITQRNLLQIDAMAELLAQRDIVLWSVFFLIPVGRGRAEQRISETEFEWVFERLWELQRRMPYGIKTTEAPHYRRFTIQREVDSGGAASPARTGLRAPIGTNDGRGVMFVSHTGQVFPSGFLPIECGRFPRESVVDVYQRSPVFRRLRDMDQLEGKCGVCEFRQVCGGSRARAYALTRNYMAAEPDCAYIPAAWTGEHNALVTA